MESINCLPQDAKERAALIDADPNVVALRAAAKMAASFAGRNSDYIVGVNVHTRLRL